MIGFIFRKAQATVDNAISQLAYGAIVAVPFLIAAGFGTAALSVRLHRDFAPEIVYLMIAGIYATIGLLAALLFGSRIARRPEVATAEAAAEAVPELTEEGGFSESDRELLITALTTAAPIALPGLLRGALRNLPILLLILAVSFVMTRPVATSKAPATAAE